MIPSFVATRSGGVRLRTGPSYCTALRPRTTSYSRLEVFSLLSCGVFPFEMIPFYLISYLRCRPNSSDIYRMSIVASQGKAALSGSLQL